MKNTYSRLKVLITGDNGFKGSWLSAWLETLGAEILGISLAPDMSNLHFNKLKSKKTFKL